MNANTWLAMLDALLPKSIVLVSEGQRQTGLVVAALMFNDKRFGIDKTTLVMFQSVEN